MGITSGAEEDTVRLAFMAEEGTDIRNQLIKELVAADIPLLELKSAGKSLEDIFLELTDQVNQETDQSRQESLSGDISVSSGDASESAGDI